MVSQFWLRGRVTTYGAFFLFVILCAALYVYSNQILETSLPVNSQAVLQNQLLAQDWHEIPRNTAAAATTGPNKSEVTRFQSPLLVNKDGDDGDFERKECKRVDKYQPHQCDFVLENCQDVGSAIFPYLAFYYCNTAGYRWVMLIGMGLWMSLLFVWVGMSASDYFSPNLGTISKLLHMPEALAGVTLLALGNGAPDLFTTMSAARAGSGGMAVGELIGSASCIVNIVIGLIALVAPNFKVDKVSFLRELSFFLLALSLIMVAVILGQINRIFSIYLISIYIAYAAVVTLTTFYEERVKRYNRLLDRVRRSYVPVREDIPPAIVMRTTSNSSSSGSRPGGGNEADDEMEDGLEAEINELQYEWWKDHSRSRYSSLLLAAEFRDFLEMLGDMTQQRFTSNSLRPQSSQGIYSDTSPNLENSANVHQPVPIIRLPVAHDQQSIYSQETSLLHKPSGDHSNTELPSIKIMPATPRTELMGMGKGSSNSPQPTILDLNDYELGSQIPSSSNSNNNNNNTLASNEGSASLNLHSSSNTPLKSSISPKIQPLLSPELRSQSDDGDTERSIYGHGLGSHLQMPHQMDPRPSISSSVFYYHDIPRLQDQPQPGWMLWARVVLRETVPTLRHWKSNAKLYTKLFLVFSAVPVFFLTMTIPVLSEPPQGDLGNERRAGLGSGNPISDSSDGQNTSTHDEERALIPRISPQSTSSSMQSNVDNGFLAVPHSPIMPSNVSTKTVETVFSQYHDPLIRNVPPEKLEKAEWCIILVKCITVPVFISVMSCVIVGTSRLMVFVGLGIGALTALYGLIKGPGFQESFPYYLKILPCFLGFASALSWIYIIADEMVAILQTIGIVFNMSEDILGLTILGWGNTIGDLVTNFTMAKMGFPRMAIAACFGSPMLNLLLGVGLAANAAAASKNGKPFKISLSSPAVPLSIAMLFIGVVMTLFAVSANGYRMTQRVGKILLCIYLLTFVSNVLLEYYYNRES
ncbi:hypothetical protein H4219_001852 [Mycoemilia scoparia]|uniref:Sodium/calcium exchanger membrane region domain-containing protein n=1 Tax=Mycoemilia scoparia TaxID=417184 RepID=A0A9W8A744_9FUNG|nr:hypothetical protein H4219_001852 [Mycoemilia scoparia]